MPNPQQRQLLSYKVGRKRKKVPKKPENRENGPRTRKPSKRKRENGKKGKKKKREKRAGGQGGRRRTRTIKARRHWGKGSFWQARTRCRGSLRPSFLLSVQRATIFFPARAGARIQVGSGGPRFRHTSFFSFVFFLSTAAPFFVADRRRGDWTQTVARCLTTDSRKSGTEKKKKKKEVDQGLCFSLFAGRAGKKHRHIEVSVPSVPTRVVVAERGKKREERERKPCLQLRKKGEKGW